MINRVDGLSSGIYRYLPLEHKLILVMQRDDLTARLDEAVRGQTFIGKAAAVFFWSCIPYRSEYAYAYTAQKMMLIDAGHVCQNLYLACESIGCGTCAVGAFDQEKVDDFLQLDGDEEFVISLAPVGKRVDDN